MAVRLHEWQHPFGVVQTRGVEIVGFEEKPIASASIGQVHKGKLRNGVRVVVKVQRPGIHELMEIDIDLLYHLVELMQKHIKGLEKYNLKGIIDEFKRYTLNELDYLKEGRNIDRFYKNFLGSDTVKVPKVHWDFTTKKVLVMGYVDGVPIDDKEGLKDLGCDVKIISRNLANCFLKQVFEKLIKTSEKYHLRDYDITMEATHHGPLINKPCLFIEIGSTEEEWKDKRAGFAVAKTISETIQEFKENKYYEIAVGIGGPHYCPEFNKLQLDSNVAISHVIPKYISQITEEMIKEVWKKTGEEVDFAIVDWKGLGNAEQRQKVIDVLEEIKLPWKKLGDVER